MVAFAHNTLPENYTSRRPIGAVTRNCAATLGVLEAAWVVCEWRKFRGGIEDEPFNVIMEKETPSGVRVWVVDRDGPESLPVMMLPEDY